jgi:lysophospholipase L1-like esterase
MLEQGLRQVVRSKFQSNLMQPRLILVTLLTLIAGTLVVTTRAQGVDSSDHPGVGAFSASPLRTNSFESEVTSLEARLLQTPVASSPIVFYGSSSIRLWKSLQQDFSGYAVLNIGFGGSRLTDCVHYANRLVLPRKPASIVIYAGDNDLAVGTPPETVFSSFQKLFGIFRGYSPSVPIAFVSVKPSPARLIFLPNILKFNQLVRDFLKTQPETDYIDVFDDMLGQDHKPVLDLFVSDHIHLSPGGYQIMRRDIGEFLSQDCAKSKLSKAQ